MADVVTEDRSETRPAPTTTRAPVPLPRDRAHDETVQSLPRRRSRRVLRYSLFVLGAAVLSIGGIWYYLSNGRLVTTDDAYVQANVLTVSTDVSGIVEQIPVAEGQHVAKGQILFRLDSDKFRIALNNARANLDQTVLTLQSLKADYLRAQRQVAAQAAIVQNDQANYDRYAALVQRGAVTQQQVDDAKYKLAADQAALGANQANVESVLARLGGKVAMPIEQMPAYQQAQAQLAEARREYNHSIVRAPFAGVVTQVNKLQPGQFLAAGTAAFGLVQTSDMWVAAEPKETALTFARPGQAVTVTVDTYPGATWHGTVQSIARATDQEFSVLPAQNSSGNWVKVVQRVPVRIDIEPDPHQPPLSAGMSAEVAIDTHHHRTLADLF
ncbi:MAG TPA: HlyD family secretion protein [Acetobacteraceae bacterium]|nr:HlyD family secretion protein [Acetobacteraceae bacterium]